MLMPELMERRDDSGTKMRRRQYCRTAVLTDTTLHARRWLRDKELFVLPNEETAAIAEVEGQAATLLQAAARQRDAAKAVAAKRADLALLAAEEALFLAAAAKALPRLKKDIVEAYTKWQNYVLKG